MVKDINECFIVPEARIILSNTGEMIDISNSIRGIGVKNDFIMNKMPLFSITLKTTETIRDIIRDNDIEIFIQCNVCDNTGDINNLDSESIYEKGTLFSETIRIYDKPYEFNNRINDEDNPSENNIGDSVNEVYVTLNGVMTSTLKLNSGLINEVYANTTGMSAIFNLLSRVGLKDIIVGNDYSTTIHKNILIPPMPPLLSVSFIQNFYNVFLTNINTYIDVGGKVYLYDPTKISKYTNTIDLKVTKNNTNNMTENIRPRENTENENIYISSIEDPAYVTGGKLQTHDIGTKTIFATYDEMFNATTREYAYAETYTKTNLFWNPDNMLSSEQSLYSGVKQTDAVSYILANVNPYRISPFTKFKVDSPSAMIAGEYSVISMSFTLESQGSTKYMNSMVHLNTLKIKE